MRRSGSGRRARCPSTRSAVTRRLFCIAGKLRIGPEERVVVSADGEGIRYDKLLVAVGARAQRAVPGAISFGGPADVPGVDRPSARRAGWRSWCHRPRAGRCPYELAIMAAIDLRDRGVEPEITVVTPEP